MKAIRVTYSDGQSLITDISSDMNAARDYFVGQEFNLGDGEEDYMVTCVKIEEVA